MKVLFDHACPFQFAHGGVQIQIEQTKRALERHGIEAEWLRWWDAGQCGDVVHWFGEVPSGLLDLARAKGLATVITTLFTATCNRPGWRLRLQGLGIRAFLRQPFFEGLKRQLHWRSWRLADRCVAGLEAERRVLDLVCRVP